MVQAVKRFVSGFILEPKVLSPTHKLADLDKLKAATGIASEPWLHLAAAKRCGVQQLVINHSYSQAFMLRSMLPHIHSKVPVTENGQLGSKVVGIVTSRDSDLCEDRGEYLSRDSAEGTGATNSAEHEGFVRCMRNATSTGNGGHSCDSKA